MATITALFDTKESAERAFQLTIGLGYDASDITVVMSAQTREQHFPPQAAASATELEAKAAAAPEKSGDKLGGPVGGTVGTLAPVVAGVGAALIPGIGVVVGPLATALIAAGAVGIAGGVLGIMANWGIPDSRLKEYKSAVEAGGILLGVKAKSSEDAQQIWRFWQECGGRLIHS